MENLDIELLKKAQHLLAKNEVEYLWKYYPVEFACSQQWPLSQLRVMLSWLLKKPEVK